MFEFKDEFKDELKVNYKVTRNNVNILKCNFMWCANLHCELRCIFVLLQILLLIFRLYSLAENGVDRYIRHRQLHPMGFAGEITLGRRGIMKSRTHLFLLAGAAAILLIFPIAAYIGKFGVQWSGSQEVWGQFGDFFGGFLNPLFSLLAFVAVLYNLHLQSEQLEVAKEEFRNAADATKLQLDALREQSNRTELVAILRSLTETIDEVLNEVVSPPGSALTLVLHHVIHEGWRLRHAAVTGGPYDEYVRHARTGGTIIDALHNRLRIAADDLAHFVPQYAEVVGKSSPVLRYYSHRYLGLGQLLVDVGGAKGATTDFFLQAEREA